jgi:hypothetical protein
MSNAKGIWLHVSEREYEGLASEGTGIAAGKTGIARLESSRPEGDRRTRPHRIAVAHLVKRQSCRDISQTIAVAIATALCSTEKSCPKQHADSLSGNVAIERRAKHHFLRAALRAPKIAAFAGRIPKISSVFLLPDKQSDT